jgi:hypothetical protein
VAEGLLRRIREEGPLRSIDLEGPGSTGWWDLKVAKKVATALWSSGELAIRERRNFQRIYDLAERVIPDQYRTRQVPKPQALETLLIRALAGHGWASTGTLTQTWRLRNCAGEVKGALARLCEKGLVNPCQLVLDDGTTACGWVRFADLELAARLETLRPRRDRGVLLSPFDPVLWDRRRVAQLFAFHQILEIFKPAGQRIYGYFCLPVLAGERLVARVDLKADRKARLLKVLATHFENSPPPARDEAATTVALNRYSSALNLELS